MAYFPSMLGIGTPYRTDVGTGSAGPYVVTHNLGTRDFCAVVRRNAGQVDNIGLATPGEIIDVQVVPTGLNTCSIIPDEIWSTSQMHVAIYPISGEDVTAPGTPVVAIGTLTSSTIPVTVTGSDNVGVTFWEWDLNGTYVGRTAVGTAAWTFTGLTASTLYTVGCTAVDLQGNRTRGTNTATTSSGPAVAFGAAGTYNAAAATQYTATTTSSLVVSAGASRCALVMVEVSNINAVTPAQMTVGVTSNLGGTWTAISAPGINVSTGNTGSVYLFYCLNPAVGTHTLTANVSNSVQWLDWVRIGSVFYFNVASVVARVTRDNLVANAALSAAVTSAVGNMAFLALGSAAAAVSLTAGTSRVNGGADNNGAGDFLLMADLTGAATATFTGSSTIHGYITADLVKA